MKPKLNNYKYIHENGIVGTIPITFCEVCLPEAEKEAASYNKGLCLTHDGVKQFCSHDQHKELVAKAEEAERVLKQQSSAC